MPDDETVRVTLSWIIATSSCPKNMSAPDECPGTHSSCLEDMSLALMLSEGSGYVCKCSDGYQGNPYVADGPDACKGIAIIE